MADRFGGNVHLACAWLPTSPSVAIAAGFSPTEALVRAEARAAAIAALYEGPGGDGHVAGGKELSLSDFVPGPPISPGPQVAGVGLVSHEPYRLPAEVVWLREADDISVEPTMVGMVGEAPNAVAAGVADVIAHDVVSRWWARPRPALLRASTHLAGLLPSGLAASFDALDLRVSAFLIPGMDVEIAIVGVSGDGASIAAAAGRSARAAVSEAFLRAVACRAQPWSTLPTADSLRRLTVWHREADYLAYLERSAVEADSSTLDLALGDVTEGAVRTWAESALRRFGHEPVLIGTMNDPAKVVCPGAACYRSTPSGTTLPCPVP